MTTTRTAKPPVIVCKKSQSLAESIDFLRRQPAATTGQSVKLAEMLAEQKALLDPRKEAAEAALREVNGTATAFTVHSWKALAFLAVEAEDELEAKGVTQKNRAGVRVTYTPAGPTAKAYKNAAISTRVTLRRNTAGAWMLDRVDRVMVWPKNAERRILTINAYAWADIARAAHHGIVVEGEG